MVKQQNRFENEVSRMFHSVKKTSFWRFGVCLEADEAPRELSLRAVPQGLRFRWTLEACAPGEIPGGRAGSPGRAGRVVGLAFLMAKAHSIVTRYSISFEPQVNSLRTSVREMYTESWS